MDTQLKRGVLENCVLTALWRDDSYGYKIVRDLSPYVEISESTLYPILKRLEQGDFLSVYSSEHNGRLRKYYRINPTGRQKVTDFLSEWKEITVIYDYITKEVEGNEQN